MEEQKTICYVAADPAQPGAAWAFTVIKPEYATDNAKAVAQWIREGANVLVVDLPTAREMLTKWKRPPKKGKKINQLPLAV